MPLLEVKPVIAPYRGSANHQFTGGFDFSGVTSQVVTSGVTIPKERLFSVSALTIHGCIYPVLSVLIYVRANLKRF